VCAGRGGGAGGGSTRNDTPDVRTVYMTCRMVTGLFYFNQMHKYVCIHIRICGWRRPIECLKVAGHFSQKSH